MQRAMETSQKLLSGPRYVPVCAHVVYVEIFSLIAQVANLVDSSWGHSHEDFELLKAEGRPSSYSGL